MTRKPDMIPIPVRDLLNRSWGDDLGPTVFDTTRTDRRFREDPAFYFLQKDAKGSILGGMTGLEFYRMHESNAFGPHSTFHDSKGAVNEHAAHALLDFLAETTLAWAKYRERLKSLPIRSPRRS